MSAHGFIEHNGKQVLVFDFSTPLPEEQAIARVSDARQVVADLAAKNPGIQLLILTDVQDAQFSQPIVDAIKAMAKHNKPYARKSAVVGLDAFKRIVVRLVALFSGRDIRAMESRAQALAWLTTD